jgi:hypothetical protein
MRTGLKLRYINVRRYQVSSTLFVLVVLVVSAVAAVAATYIWASKMIPLSVEEPLTVTGYPSMLSTHPGENMTLEITIMNSANVEYLVFLAFTLNDTAFQESYTEFSNYTYNIIPGSNQIQGWLQVDKKSPPISLELTIDFHRE